MNFWIKAALAAAMVAANGAGITRAAETVTYYHTDALGTPVMESNAAGTVTYTREHRPYGEQALGAAKNGPAFTGHVGDAETGLTYMQARYFDPVSGRIVSNDPVAAELKNGGNYNRYWYANNNPYKFTDPDGRAPECPACDNWSDTVADAHKNGTQGELKVFEAPAIAITAVMAAPVIAEIGWAALAKPATAIAVGVGL